MKGFDTQRGFVSHSHGIRHGPDDVAWLEKAGLDLSGDKGSEEQEEEIHFIIIYQRK